MRVYFVGAQSTGKTTLARHVAKQFSLPLLAETARSIMARWERTLDEIRRDQNQLDIFQKEVFDEQRRVENGETRGFVSDRAMDFAAYAAAKTTVACSMVNTPAFANYIESLKFSDVLIFFVRPHKEFVVADNVRAKADLEWDEVVKIDAMIEYLLESNGLRYFPVASKLLRDRIRLVDAAIELAIRVEKYENQGVSNK